jgi:hypothetical protein
MFIKGQWTYGDRLIRNKWLIFKWIIASIKNLYIVASFHLEYHFWKNYKN